MGADIYLQSVHDAQRAEWSPRFEAAVAARDAKYGRKDGPADSPEQRAVTEAYDAMYARGYFRDSYNATSLFWLYGKSWWGNDHGANKQGFMSVRAMSRLRAFLLSPDAAITPELMLAWAKAQKGKDGGGAVVDDGENSLEAWGQMFERKRCAFVALLDEAIGLKEPLRCSC